MAAKNIRPKYDMIRFTYHSEDRIETDGFLKQWGQDPKDFLEEDKVLEREAEMLDELEAKRKPGEKPEDDGVVRSKKFMSTEVSERLEETRAKQLKRAGLKQVREGINDSGGQLFDSEGANNAVMPTIITALVAVGFCLIEVERLRKPARYTKWDERKAEKKIDQLFERQVKLALLGELSVEGILNKDNHQEKLEPLLNEADALQLAYLRSIKVGKLKKTHPTASKPYGSVQVWKYTASAILLFSDEGIGLKLAGTFEEKVLKRSFWKHCHIWANPDGSATVNVMSPPSQDGVPRFFTHVGFSAETGEFTAKVFVNKHHPAYDPEDPEVVKVFRERAKREQKRLDKAMRDRVADDRIDAHAQAWRPAPGSRLGDQLNAKLEGKNGDNTPVPPAS